MKEWLMTNVVLNDLLWRYYIVGLGFSTVAIAVKFHWWALLYGFIGVQIFVIQNMYSSGTYMLSNAAIDNWRSKRKEKKEE